MEINDMIAKWNISLVEKDGQTMINARGKFTEKQKAEIRAKKPQIIEELQRREIERAERFAKIEAEREERKAQYLSTADIRRFMVEWHDEWGNVEHYLATLEVKNGRAWQPEYGAYDRVDLIATPAMKEITKGKALEYGIGGAAWEVAPEQEAEIMAEQKPAREKIEREATEKAEKMAAEEQRKRDEYETARQAKFDEAKATGKPVLLKKHVTDCDGSACECSTDIVYSYAMPDGTTKIERIHTH